ncbi:MAG: DUF4340 domain-containing protein [Gemmatimonadota bacterium]|nr:DUF4340 domain-containing protein [Gemmatimonadota bacterium]MDE2872051.1 DUF4340 domain-containing protein [Gemmatimonadota bacterium]
MSNKTLRASLYFLGAVTALYLLVTLVRGGDREVPDSRLGAALTEIDGALLTRVEFTSPRGDILLEKEGDAWTVNGFQTDPKVVNRFLRAVDSARVGNIAATNPDNHLDMGMTTDSARKMVTSGGVTILFGKHAPMTKTGYARLPDSDTVYLVHGDLRYMVGRNEFQLRRKQMLETDTSAVATIRVTRDGATTVYERRDSVWMVNGQEAESYAIRNMLQELASMRATGFEPDYRMPEEPDRFVQALDADGNELVSLKIMQEPGNWVVSSTSTHHIFELPKFRGDRIAPEPPGGEG